MARGDRGRRSFFLFGLLCLLMVAGGLGGCYGTETAQTDKLELAANCLGDNNLRGAVQAYREAIGIDQKQAGPYLALARIYTLQRDFTAAGRVVTEGLKAVDPGSRLSLELARAGILLDQGELEQARTAYRGIADKNRGCVEAYRGLAFTYLEEERNNEAEKVLKQCEEANGKVDAAHNSLAEFYQRVGKDEQALQEVAASLAINPDQIKPFLILEGIYEGKWERLTTDLNRFGNTKVAALLRVYALYRRGSGQEAMQLYQKELANQSRYQMAAVYASLLRWRQGEREQAKTTVDRLAGKEVKPPVMLALAGFYHATGDQNGTLRWAGRYCSSANTEPEAVQVLAPLLGQGKVRLRLLNQLLISGSGPLYLAEEQFCLAGVELPSPGGGVLTPDYFLPRLDRQYRYQEQGDESKGMVTVVWSRGRGRLWIEKRLRQSGQLDDESLIRHRLTPRGVVYLYERVTRGGDEAIHEISDGECLEFLFAKPQTEWSSSYRIRTAIYGNAEIVSNRRNTGYLGLEKITMLGRQLEAAHLTWQETYSGTQNRHDEWYVKGMGLVRYREQWTEDGQSCHYGFDLASVANRES